MTASRPERPVRPGGAAPRRAGTAVAMRAPRAAAAECDLADDTRLRNWYAQLDLDTPASGHDNPRPGRIPEPGHAYRADSRVSRFLPSSPRLIGTTLVILSTLAHSPAAAVIGLILFLLAPIGACALARCTHRQEAARIGDPARLVPQTAGRPMTGCPGWRAGIWLLP